MGRRLEHFTFEQWLAHVFDHRVREAALAWYWDPDADWWDGPAVDAVQFLTRAFESAAVAFQPYTDAQLNQGLWFIASNGCSDYMLALLDSGVPWSDRRRCVRSIHTLFEQCFARRCTPHLGHLDEPGANPLNSVCYMWWDILPICGQPEDPGRNEMDREILGVLESTLQLESDACRESALHGLGHWQPYYPEQVTAIIDAFLQSQEGGLREELRVYARNAYRGCVL